MSAIHIYNDLHVGFHRQGGVTVESRAALTEYLVNAFALSLPEASDSTLVIAGDLFDKFAVSSLDILTTLQILGPGWCGLGGKLVLVAGNHDWSPRGDQVSSFELLASVLRMTYGSAVSVVNLDETLCADDRLHLVAHCSNQQAFDEKLAAVARVVKPGQYVLLHANYDNKFAAQSDHSLNVTPVQAQVLIDAGALVLFAHEHQARSALGGKVRCLGNQFPTSVADCLGNEAKYYHTLHADGTLTPHVTWRADDPQVGSVDVQWQDLLDLAKDLNGFVRVVGTATAEEASTVIDTIARARSLSKCFVMNNYVKVGGSVDAAELPELFEAASKFDVLAYVRKNLTDAQWGVLETKVISKMEVKQ